MTAMIWLSALNLVVSVAVLTVLGGMLRQLRRPVAAPSPNPAIHIPFTRAALDMRPDPTARYNVFRRDEHGRLALGDEERYSGNSAERAMGAERAYRDGQWAGDLYAYDGKTLMRHQRLG